MQLGVKRLFQLCWRCEDQSAQSAGVEHLVVLVVRQPYQPRPLLGMPSDHHELEIAWAVIDGERTHYRACQAMQFARIVADEAEPGFRPQTQHLANPANFTLLEDEIP